VDEDFRAGDLAGKAVCTDFDAHKYLATPYNRTMHDVVVYSRKGCHLCDILKETLAQLHGEADFQWREVDIDLDPVLQEKYNDEVPVVFIDGRKAYKYRMDERQFLGSLRKETKGSPR
jgi:glutaredoxin